ncbi:MAG: hemerythrin domain-containing protein [Cyclobacteriaceae bacterium]
MIDLKKLNATDPLKRMAEKESGTGEYSPMEPPEAYMPPTTDAIPYEDMHPLLQGLVDEHNEIEKELDGFEKSLLTFKENGWRLDEQLHKSITAFFSYIDGKVVKHQLKEEKVLFPVVQKALLENGEHSNGKFPKTAIDMLEDDHLKMMQHLTLVFNLISLGTRLPDPVSRALTFDVAVEQGISLIELTKLHFFREENVVFPKANKYLSSTELDESLAGMKTYAQY